VLFGAVPEAACVNGFGCRPRTAVPRAPAAGVRKPPVKETAMGERVAVPRALIYRDLTVVAVIRHHNFCVLAQKLRLVKSDFCILCNFNELRVVKMPHISTSALYTYHIG